MTYFYFIFILSIFLTLLLRTFEFATVTLTEIQVYDHETHVLAHFEDFWFVIFDIVSISLECLLFRIVMNDCLSLPLTNFFFKLSILETFNTGQHALYIALLGLSHKLFTSYKQHGTSKFNASKVGKNMWFYYVVNYSHIHVPVPSLSCPYCFFLPSHVLFTHYSLFTLRNKCYIHLLCYQIKSSLLTASHISY